VSYYDDPLVTIVQRHEIAGKKIKKYTKIKNSEKQSDAE
jgi:hypothetical protein